MDILDELNPEQKKAVQHVDGPLLILAGAGSGKTRVITHRIAYLIKKKNVSPFNILAVTFTNKAADEMKSRVENLVGMSNWTPWIATFHSTCARILRRNIDRLGYSKSFTIYDADDQTNLIREIIEDISIGYSEKEIINKISRAKENLIDYEEFAAQVDGNSDDILLAQIYEEYQNYLEENNALDFDDLIMLTIRLFDDNPNVLEYYQRKFQYVLVDEYQDTNHSQYILVHMFADKHKNVCVVGDDDQSIYSWRGADISNILDFEEDYKSVETFYLEQNYRSTKKILDAANEVIKNNQYRKAKRLWCDNKVGKNLFLYEADDEEDEAKYVVEKIRQLVDQGANYNDCAVFYRTNAQSRSFEDYLRDSGMPYNVVGGFQYYKRMEVKDILAYLRLLVNPADALSLKRVINRPRRGIGTKTLNRLEYYAQKMNVSLFEAVRNVENISSIGTRGKNSVRKFVKIMDSIDSSAPPNEVVENVIKKSKYAKSLEEKDTVKAQTRAENARGLIAVAREYERQNDPATLEGFLENVALISDADKVDEETDQVNLMTLHSAKGLEFPIVFMTGMEMGLFPHKLSMGEISEFEEERRLCYVGITRAMQRIYMTYAIERQIYGFTTWNEPSLFLDEIPPELIEIYGEDKQDALAAEADYEPVLHEESLDFDYTPGEIVYHSNFGKGKITKITGSGEDMRVKVRFFGDKERAMMAKYANLRRKD